ncbi:DNA-directed RNA polymerase [Cladorrhinum sp. PSN259]|nr:DNA-directed RNA polymerase [Cladorrhinum sp. PSN259]
MASVKKEGEEAKIEILKNTLYDTITQHGSSTRLFSQEDLLDLDVIPNRNLALLLRVIQGLTNDKLLVGVQNGPGSVAWRYRSREDAKKYTSLPDETTILVYQAIDEAGNDGIWKRTIEYRVNITEAVLKACIKILESRGLITTMQSVEQPNKKMYIRADLRPSDRATGGPWFNQNGELDSDLIETLQSIVFEFIKDRSTYRQKALAPGSGAAGASRIPKNGAVTATPSVIAGTKRPAKEMASDDVTPASTPIKPAPSAPTRVAAAPKKDVLLPLPAGYKAYPTITEITEFIHNINITTNVTLGESNIKQLVDLLVYEGVVEPIKVGRRKGYRVLRPTKQDPVQLNDKLKSIAEAAAKGIPGISDRGAQPRSNGLTEAPCSTCPVFSLCEEGGAVSPSGCVYFMEWLGLESKNTANGVSVGPP